MYSGRLADGIWGEAPNAYVPGSTLAHWKLCIAAGLQMEYGMRPGCICARVDTRELGAMYSGGLADGIWGEAPDAYVPGSILAYWKLCIAAGLQMEYGMRPGCICARVDTRELGAMYSDGLADGIWGEAPNAYVPG